MALNQIQQKVVNLPNFSNYSGQTVAIWTMRLGTYSRF